MDLIKSSISPITFSILLGSDSINSLVKSSIFVITCLINFFLDSISYAVFSVGVKAFKVLI